MIKIGERVRITKIDKINLLLEFKDEVVYRGKSEMKWTFAGYYGDLRSALHGAYKKYSLVIDDGNLNDLKIAIEKIDNIFRLIEGATQ